jgi:hypothetical protein
MNPLNEKALYYSQKLHGRLEDTLNARSVPQDEGYQEWSQSPEFEQRRPVDQEYGEKPGPGPMEPPSAFADAVRKISEDPAALNSLITALERMRTESMQPETKQAVNLLYDLLLGKTNNLGQIAPETVQTGNGPLGDIGGDDVNWDDLNSEDYKPASINVQKLTKVADILEGLDEGLTELLRDYLRKQEEELPYFPETASLIKEEPFLERKLTQKKAGAVALNT